MPNPWELFARRGAQGDTGVMIVPRGAYAALATYAINDIVTYAGSVFRAVAAGVLGQPNLTPAAWELLAAGGIADAVLSEGVVTSGGFSLASISSGTPSYVDVTGCACAPNTVSPVDLAIGGMLLLSSTQAAATNYRMIFQVLDDLGAVAGNASARFDLSTGHAIWLPFSARVGVTPASALRTYKLQATMLDATGGTAVFAGSVFGGAGNQFRLTARAR